MLQYCSSASTREGAGNKKSAQRTPSASFLPRHTGRHVTLKGLLQQWSLPPLPCQPNHNRKPRLDPVIIPTEPPSNLLPSSTPPWHFPSFVSRIHCCTVQQSHYPSTFASSPFRLFGCGSSLRKKTHCELRTPAEIPTPSQTPVRVTLFTATRNHRQPRRNVALCSSIINRGSLPTRANAYSATKQDSESGRLVQQKHQPILEIEAQPPEGATIPTATPNSTPIKNTPDSSTHNVLRTQRRRSINDAPSKTTSSGGDSKQYEWKSRVRSLGLHTQIKYIRHLPYNSHHEPLPAVFMIQQRNDSRHNQS